MNETFTNLVLFIFYLAVLIKSANYATIFSGRIAKTFRISEFMVSFFIVAFLSAMPETTVAIFSVLDGVPELGLGALIGSNVADLALVFGIITLFSANGLRVKSEVIKKDFFYVILLIIPIVFGIDGRFDRIEGIVLVISGMLFFLSLYRDRKKFTKEFNNQKNGHTIRNLFFLLISVVLLVGSSNLTVKYAVLFAHNISLPPIIIGLTIVAIGTCLPELFFSIRSIKSGHQSLAIGDILGTVMIDTTIILGLIAIMTPFSFNAVTFYITAIAMVLAASLLMLFMRTGRVLSKTEGFVLILFYIVFLMTEFIVNGL